MNKLLLTIIFFASTGLVLPLKAQQCTYKNGGPPPSEVVRFPDMTVDPYTPEGSVLVSVSATALASRGEFIYCTSPVSPITMKTVWSEQNLSQVVYEGEVLYATGISGLAIRIVTPGGIGGEYTGTLPRAINRAPPCYYADQNRAGGYCGGSWGGVTFELVKIGDTGAGTVNISGQLQAVLPAFGILHVITFNSFSINAPRTTCSISVPPVDLQEHSASVFGPVGSFTPWKDFNITSQGCKSGVVKVHMRFAGTANADNPNLFALTPGGARGVGIELQARDGRPAAPNSMNALDWEPAPNGGSYPMRARYTKTLPDVVPGVANGVAEINMSYN
ncbi:fimbrial protein [Collimonas sp. NPDC087041]|uniref:fimbrial protein n=1 Tax=Collimonas sp. NPDC087041 TaxID=3363960 RepID=UPI0037FDC382